VRHTVACVALTACAALLAGCGGGDRAEAPLPAARETLTLASPAFADGTPLPRRFTCSGAGVSPPLRWWGAPRGTRELALVVEDSDADRFVHWTVLEIPPTERRFTEGAAPAGTVETENSFGDRGWGPPCPPEGDDPHRYVFALYAADAPLGLGADASADAVRAALADHALARGLLTGRFARG
jgi:Raf kinase inhibitor-like YbhB/YbcL family protein